MKERQRQNRHGARRQAEGRGACELLLAKRFGSRLGDLPQNGLRVAVEPQSRLGRHDSLRGPHEERAVEFDFEMGDLLAQSRLRNMQLRAGLGEAAVVDDPDQIAKLTQFQWRSSQASLTLHRGGGADGARMPLAASARPV